MGYNRTNMRKRVLATAVVLTITLGLATVLCQQDQRAIKVMEPAEVHQMALHDSVMVLLDVRTPEEYEGGHVANSILIPVQELEARLGELDSVKTTRIVTICRSGNRSARAALILQERGFNAFNMAGGMLKWNAEGLPVVREGQR